MIHLILILKKFQDEIQKIVKIIVLREVQKLILV